MDRRRYLARAGGLGVIAVAAGCLASDSDGTDRAAADRTGERALERAVGKLNQAALALGEDLDGVEDPVEASFDADEPRDLIATAREHLGTAATALDDDRRPDVAELRSYADVLEGLVDVADTIADDALADDVETVTAAIAEDGRIEDAIRIVDERNADLHGASDRLDEAESDLETLDADRLDELSIVDLEEIENGVAALDGVLSSMLTLGSGYETMLDGYESLEGGGAAAEDGNYEGAADEFEAAESAFGTSRADFDDGVADAPSGLVSYFETARCQSEALETAAGHFASSATAAANGDLLTAERRRAEGEAALEDAADCSS
ncbi:hypothetical protein [Halosolutus halophilus]|uniref:hypothetical protein n=1 Tax=Halosolutus halophilus TaxID=1552990 RepID=UPI002235296A|nr:hypothetical protein [Halosolutus halophilus]